MIQRFSIHKIDDGVTVAPDDNGPWVPAEALEMEVRAAERRGWQKGYDIGWKECQELVAALAAIDALKGEPNG